MHLRRALLLFAIVLGLAAVAAAVSRPGDDGSDGDGASTSPSSEGAPTVESGTTVSPHPDAEAAQLRFAIGSGAKRVAAGRPATVVVEVDEPGQAHIEGLGLTAAAEPLTPARFDVLVESPGRYPISFTPAAGGESREAGTLVVTAAGE